MNLTETFFKFVSIEDFRSELLNPEKFEDSAITFQDSLANLLSLSGCSVVTLKKERRETAREEAGQEIGSADLIAYYVAKEKLCFVDCTTTIPDESKIRKLKTTMTNLAPEERRSRPKVFGLIPSPRDCSDIKRNYFDDIYIVDRSDLEEILNLLQEGRIEDARTKLFF